MSQQFQTQKKSHLLNSLTNNNSSNSDTVAVEHKKSILFQKHLPRRLRKHVYNNYIYMYMYNI